MKTWNPIVALHVLSVVLAFLGPNDKKDDAQAPKKSSKPETAAQKTKDDVKNDSKVNTKNDVKKEVKKDADRSDKKKVKNDADKDSRHEAHQGASEDEQAVRKVVEQFEKAFNDHDAKAVAALFGKDAEVVNAEGHQYRGREEIEQSFSAFFEEVPDVSVSVDIDSIRPLGSALMIEEGTSTMTIRDEDPQDIVRYTVIYSKEDNDWAMIYARDTTADEANDQHIKRLAWLIGDWIDESSEAVVVTNYRWSENQRAIEGEFHLHAPGYPSMDGKQRIAWDPQAKQLRSWIFDSEGGFASGLWSETEEGWIVKMAGVLPDGQTTSATNSFHRQSDDHLVFRSVDRVIGGMVLPDGEEITVVRHAPKPEEISAKP